MLDLVQVDYNPSGGFSATLPKQNNLVTGSVVPLKAVLNNPLAGYTAEVPRFWSVMDQGRGVSRFRTPVCWQPANVLGVWGQRPQWYRQNLGRGLVRCFGVTVCVVRCSESWLAYSLFSALTVACMHGGRYKRGPTGGACPDQPTPRLGNQGPSVGPHCAFIGYAKLECKSQGIFWGLAPNCPQYYPFQNAHQGRAVAGFKAVAPIIWCSSPISLVLSASCCLRSVTVSFSSSTRALPSPVLVVSPGGGAAWSPPLPIGNSSLSPIGDTSTIHRNPPAQRSLVAGISPALTRFLTVSWATPRWALAWAIVMAVIGYSFVPYSRRGHCGATRGFVPYTACLHCGAVYPSLPQQPTLPQPMAYARLGQFPKPANAGSGLLLPAAVPGSNHARVKSRRRVYPSSTPGLLAVPA